MQRAVDRAVGEIVVNKAIEPAVGVRLQQQAVNRIIAVLRQCLMKQQGAVRARQPAQKVSALSKQPGRMAEMCAPGGKAKVGAKCKQVDMGAADQQGLRRVADRQQGVDRRQLGGRRRALDGKLDILVVHVAFNRLLAKEKTENDDGPRPQMRK